MGDVMITRRCRSLKNKCVYMHAFETGSEVQQGIERWVHNDNMEGPAPVLTTGGPMRPIGRNPNPVNPVPQSLWRHGPNDDPPSPYRQPVLRMGAPHPVRSGSCYEYFQITLTKKL